jgi:REP element-mobilizing transposase RayT
MIRGIEGRRIVDDDQDRSDLVRRMGELAAESGAPIYAWALMSNHAHILLSSGMLGLAPFMRRLLTGHAVNYNLRHRRHGHLFQNRYKSIVCDGDSYFTELVRYIHLNPLRVKLVRDIKALEKYPYCGHGAILGKVSYDWQDCHSVLAQFGGNEGQAREEYHRFVEEGIALGRRPELVGGGLLRSAGGWAEVRSQRQRRPPQQSDERILGSEEFVERVLGARATPTSGTPTKRTGRASYRGGVQEKWSIFDGTQKREPTGETVHDKSGIGVQAGGRFWRRARRGCAPTRNINLWGFEDIDQKFVQLVNNVPQYVPNVPQYVPQ